MVILLFKQLFRFTFEYCMYFEDSDIIKYYLGSMFKVITKQESFYVIINLLNCEGTGFCCGYDIYGIWREFEPFEEGVKVYPLLKYTGDLTKAETDRYEMLCLKTPFPEWNRLHTSDSALSIAFLVKNGYDVFDLIEQGRALDIKTVSERELNTALKFQNG